MSFVQSAQKKERTNQITLDPRTKLLMLLFASFLAVLINDNILLAALNAVIIILTFISNVNIRLFWRAIKPVLFLVPAILIIQIIFPIDTSGYEFIISFKFNFFNQLQISKDSILISTGTILSALIICQRVLILTMGSVLFSLTTDSSNYLQSLQRIKIPYTLAFTTGLVIYFLPMITSEVNNLQIALETRGVSINRGSFRKRIQAFQILLTALLMNFLEKSKYQAIALDTRGFNTRKKRTYFNRLKLSVIDFIMIILSIALFGVIVYFFREMIAEFFKSFSNFFTFNQN
ncbi:MAG: energy-coupling factor transporter transmembrane protein EcfT [Asgard group archaeon]|nr:energy-coupling factor transporter transmembrane protein EcfT [Asgard group archaeon]